MGAGFPNFACMSTTKKGEEAMAATAPTTVAIRDQLGDHLLTPKNSALAVIDYQPSQLSGVRSMDRDVLLKNVVSTAKVAKLFGLPILHSTINVRTGRGKPTLPPLAELLVDNPPIDRTTTNAWEDPDFLSSVRATGRRKLIICALWTEICMAFPALDAMRQATRSTPWSTRLAGPPSRRTARGSTVSSRPEANRLAGFRSRSSCSATGRAWTRCRRSSRSC